MNKLLAQSCIRVCVRLSAVVLLLASTSLAAHEPMRHACDAPERPVNDSNDELWQQFVSDIDAFRDCVNDKMQWHQSAANIHEENARQVVNVWNDFVQTSLNAPEDFPWPPE